ncbi:MAG TPA: prepilin-type N-terminal cleavage/methylation domain-containing protein [Pirellulales bacterium]|jgi:prepilin-type N-terminal cleavage/methylation domain-containing protein|nr:prepilin-type N-terminal cleavage/methylation domain-containing protein [Pirellulales bacterium]
MSSARELLLKFASGSIAAQRRRAFSLLELLMVIVLVSILAKMVITNAVSTAYDQLHSVANIVAGELAYARGLAVGNDSTYCFTLDTTNNRLVLTYTGSDPTLATLPNSPFRSPTDASNQYTVSLSTLPSLGIPVKLLGGQAVGTTTQTITSVEFGPYGSTTQANQSVLWLTAGTGTSRRYISVTVNPVTGLSSVGTYTNAAPSGITIPSP